MANAIVCTIDGANTITPAMTFPDALGQLYQGTLTTAPTVALVLAAGSSTLAVKTIHLRNITSNDVVASFYEGGSSSSNQIASIRVPANAGAAYENDQGWIIYDASGARLINSSQMFSGPLTIKGNNLTTSVATFDLTQLQAGALINLDAYNNATAVTAFGDSITVGTGASPASNAYINLTVAVRLWTLTNDAVSGSQVADQWNTGGIASQVVGQGSQYTYFLGFNDARQYLSDANKQAFFRSATRANLAYLAIPDSNKVLGSAGTLTGTWTSPTTYTSRANLSAKSTNVGSTWTGSVYGSAVYLGLISQNGNTCTFSVSIDGVNQGTFSCGTPGNASITTFNGATFGPQLLRFAGLTETIHTVVITIVSWDGTNAVWVDWLGGNLGNVYPGGPNIWAGNYYRMNPAGANYASDAIMATFNGILRQEVYNLANDGLNIQLVDLASRMNTTTDIYTDNVHPNNQGHAKIALAFEEGINQIQKPRVAGVHPPISAANTIRGNAGSTAAAQADLTPAQVLGSTLLNLGGTPGSANATGTLSLVLANPALQVRDTNGSNSAWYGAFLDAANLSANRNPATGIFTDTTKCAAQLTMQGAAAGSGNAAGGQIVFYTSNTNNATPAEALRVSQIGNISVPAGNTAMASGFFYIPSAAGPPTGAPLAISGAVPMYYDSTNNNFYIYNGAWKKVGLT